MASCLGVEHVTVEPYGPAAVIERLRVDAPPLHGDGRLRWDVSPATLAFLADVVRPGDRTLEVGCGVSTVVFAAAQSRHVAMSPAPAEFAYIEQYCAGIGVDTTGIEYHEGLSHDVLPRLAGTFDVALIDGAHSFPFPVVDYHYVSRLLRPGGVLVLDDVPIPAVAIVYRFLLSEPAWSHVAVLDDRAAAFTLLRPLDPGDPWGSQRINRRYPDRSFLPAPRRVRIALVDRTAQSALVRRMRGRSPLLDKIAPAARRWLS